MTIQLLETQVEQIIRENQCISISDIAKKIKTSSVAVLRGLISVIMLRNNWRYKYERGRTYITTEIEIKESSVNHREEGLNIITAKTMPLDGDWVVTAVEDSRERMYFNGDYSCDEVRSAYAKLTKAKFADVRCCRYHKLRPIKTMHNF